MRQTKRSFLVVAAALATILSAPSQANPQETVVFVCEHGNAKSVVAAAHFNRIASERNLPYRAVARGTHPDPGPSPKATKGLQADGLPVDLNYKPVKLTKEDTAGAKRVVAFVEVPSEFQSTPIERWSGVPNVKDGYDQARDKIVAHVERLVDELDKKAAR